MLERGLREWGIWRGGVGGVIGERRGCVLVAGKQVVRWVAVVLLGCR